MFLRFKVSSKDRHALNKFLSFIQRLATSSIVVKHFSKQKKRKVITILKSPHVNKTAQEQFEFRFYTKEFLISSTQPFTLFLTIKKIKNLSFPGLKLEVKSLLNVNKTKKTFLKRLDPDNIVLSCDKAKTFNSLTFQKKYIQLFDCYGELCLKKFILHKTNS
uniref:Ribosomal protein S10 n=1 Tax=Nitzschia anatoliensis TaxID=2862141 RepID=A0A8F7PYY5_9STRA|nr:ribosomal protein S10 [Nitzschia anatoliensis]